MRIHASDSENTNSEDEDRSLRASEMRDLRNPVRPVLLNELDLNDTVIVNENPEAEDYHMVEFWFLVLLLVLQTVPSFLPWRRIVQSAGRQNQEDQGGLREGRSFRQTQP